MSSSGISKIAILGAGTMGPSIAQVFASNSSLVKLWSRTAKTLEKAEAAIKSNLAVFVNEGEITKQEAERAISRVSFTCDLKDAISNADIIIETIVENREAKKALYEQLDDFLEDSEDLIIASNTSALNPFELMPERRLKNTMIMHWYTPAQIVPLVDVVKSEEMPQELCDRVVRLLKDCGKTPVAMKKYINGYIVNRMQICLNQEIFFLLDNGYCTPEDIDLAVKASIIPRAIVLGMCKKIDFNGVDIAAGHYRNKVYKRPPEVDMPTTLQEHLDKGELGIKTGKGLFDYSNKDIGALIKKKDKQLMQAFKLAKQFMDDPV